MTSLCIASGISVFLIIALIQAIRKKDEMSKFAFFVLVLLTLFWSVHLADLIIWGISQTRAFNLPTKKGVMTEVGINNKWGGVSTFYIGDSQFQIDNTKNNIIRENEEINIVYTPITKTVVGIIIED